VIDARAGRRLHGSGRLMVAELRPEPAPARSATAQEKRKPGH